MDSTVLGALLALSGVVVSTAVTIWRDWRRDLRDDARQAERDRQERHLRTFFERRDAYVAFTEEMSRWRNGALNRQVMEGSLPELDFDTLDEVFEKASVVQFFGTKAASDLALANAKALAIWLNSEKDEDLKAFDQAREDFVTQVRVDLGVDE
jgi:hypothetical protein